MHFKYYNLSVTSKLRTSSQSFKKRN